VCRPITPAFAKYTSMLPNSDTHRSTMALLCAYWGGYTCYTGVECGGGRSSVQ
jgi:hypothetical protein